MIDQVLQEQAYWLLLVFESQLLKRAVNEIIVNWCQERGRTLREFFSASSQEWREMCQLDEKMIEKLNLAKAKIAEQVTLVERLVQKHIHILTVVDENYPRRLKSALSLNERPPILFYAGDLVILELTSVAIIGSRRAIEESLAFTRLAAQYLAEQGANVISGNARGVDRAAFEGAANSCGCTTVVLPQGICKLSGVQKAELLPKIEAGSVLLLSQFHPDAHWVVSRAMERNKVVTGLAQIVIVAEADIHGGTWEGANGALRQYRPVYVRQSDAPSLLPGNKALLEPGGRPLYWPTNGHLDDYSQIEDVISPLLYSNDMLYQSQNNDTSTLQKQISRLLKEHWVSL